MMFKYQSAFVCSDGFMRNFMLSHWLRIGVQICIWDERTVQSYSPGLDRFSRFCKAHSRLSYTLQWAAPYPVKIFPSHVGCGPPSNIWFPGPLESSTQTASRSVQPFLQGSLLWQTDRHTDKPNSICNSSPHLLT